MAIQSAITRKFDNGYVQVEIGGENREMHYYKVPELKADEFQKEYKKNSKKINWISAGVMLSAILAVLIPVSYLTKKIDNRILKTMADIGAGIFGGVSSMFICNKIEINSHSKLLNKYNAEVIDKSKLGINLD